jgi:hypothetical protein
MGPARSGGSFFLLLVLCAAAATGGGACRSSQPPEFAHTFASPDALATSVLDALAGKDSARLAELPLGEHEFRKWVWPNIPAGRPDVNMPFDYFWKDLSFKSRASLAASLSEFGGQRFTLRRIEFTGETTDYGSFSVSRDSELTVVDAGGRERKIRVFGSVLKAGDRYKLFSYVVD